MLLVYKIIKIKMLVIRIIIEMLLQALHKLEIHLYLLFLESTNNSNINLNSTNTLIILTCFPYWYTDRKWVCHFLFPHLHKNKSGWMKRRLLYFIFMNAQPNNQSTFIALIVWLYQMHQSTINIKRFEWDL